VDVEVELDELNRRYEERFGFRFVTFVNRRSKAEVAGELRRRLAGTRDAELTAGLDAILRIAEDRLRRSRHEIRYGKAGITVYRTYAEPLRDVPRIPESPFVGRGNELFGAQVSVDVFGDNFLGAYTEGDNSQVVATDTMKNFVHAQAVAFEGATFEGFASFLAERYLQTYPQMRRVRITMRELAWVELEADRGGVLALRCGRRDLRLVKLTGSSFAGFQRDAWTTLPERPDRPLFIFLDVLWRYREVADALDLARRRLVPSEQVRDLVQAVFDEFVSLSIQHLVHEMGTRLLDRFQQLAEVSFEAQNRLWDTVAETEGDPRRRVYADPRPAHGVIGLTLRR
jgi:urate oxidase